VKVEVFSLGFGKKLLQKQIGETQYALSLIPLGGYVKLMGDDPYKSVPAEEAARAFSTQKLYKRFCIVAAGPTANLLLAFLITLAVYFFGEPVAGTRIGTVTAESPAWKAGLRSGDRIEAVSTAAVTTWEEIQNALKTRVGEPVELAVRRDTQVLTVSYVVEKVRGRDFVGREVEIGGIKGIMPTPLEPMIGVSNPQSPAGLALLRTGDLVTKIDIAGVTVFEDIQSALSTNWVSAKPISVTVRRADEKEITVTLNLPNPVPPIQTQSPLGLAGLLGIYPSEIFIQSLAPGSPAEKGGLMVGDRIMKVGERAIHSFEAVVDEVQGSGDKTKPILFQIEREGKTLQVSLIPQYNEHEDPLTHEKIGKYMVGILPQLAYHDAEIVLLKIREPVALIKKAFEETYDLAYKTVVGIGMLATGQVSMKNLGGPLLIASVAGRSLDVGIIPFLQTMALISINLFLLNLFPIPVLDGGHLLFFLIEAIKGKPVSVKTMEVATQVGMALILMLVGLTLFNDVYRMVRH
jgi:regulator of sigma E protease